MKKERLNYPNAKPHYYFAALLSLFLISHQANSQKSVVTDSSSPGYRTVIAGNEYRAGALHKMLWGSHYRKEWTTPVKIPVIHLDTVAGGLTPIREGGGRQTKTLRLKNAAGKQFVLRSVDKDYGSALPEIARGTFIQHIAKDQVSTTHPFAPLTVPVMADAAGVYHTNPRVVFVPYTPSLGEYNQTFANTLCLFEERPDGNQEDVASFGHSKDVVSTDKMFENVYGHNNQRVDQKAFVKARLFDILIGDWSRHEDQWRWAAFPNAQGSLYRPVPRDRDQIYAQFDGLFPYVFTSPEELELLESFKGRIKNLKKFNLPARRLDRQFTNELGKQSWIEEAKALQSALPDSVIEKAVRQLPPEQFALSGQEITEKLKARRNHLVEYAEKYYQFLAKEVDVVGTPENELFEVERLNDIETRVNIYSLEGGPQPQQQPFYSRTFFSGETHEIRLYGIGGNDVFRISGPAKKGIRVRLIGGPQRDSLINLSQTARSRVQYYDDRDNLVNGKVKNHYGTDSAFHAFDYNGYRYSSGHTIKSPFYSNTRGIYINAGYTYTRQHWRKEPFSWRQTARVLYSFTNSSFGAEYEGLFNGVIGKWNLALHGSYDQALKNFFFGIGNETPNVELPTYYRLLTKEAFGSVGLNRNLGRHSLIGLAGFYQTVQINRNSDLFVTQTKPFNEDSVFRQKNFAGAAVNYFFHSVNDEVVPTKGIDFLATATHTLNVKETDRAFNRYVASATFYLPLSRSLSLAVKTGGATLDGEPEFYQLNWLGGGQNLRGFHRQRFYGKTTFYDENELRWIRDTRNYFFNGKIGLLAFVDDGRVWQPGEASNKWHLGYGGGILLAPFNKISLRVYYGLSEDDKLVHLRLGRYF